MGTERYGADGRSSHFLQSVLDALSATIAILDADGIIIAVNAAWRRFGDENGLTWPNYGVGRNYLAIMDAAEGDQAADARYAVRGIRGVMAGARADFSFEYPCDSPDEQRWYMMWATPLALSEKLGTVIAHEDITQRKLSELAAEDARREAEIVRRAEMRQRRAAERRRAVAAGLGNVLAILNSDQPLSQVLGSIVDQAQSLLGARMVAVFQAGSDEALLYRTARGDHQTPLLLSTISADLSDLERPDFTDGGVIITNPESTTAPLPSTPGTTLGAPINVSDERYGVLIVQYGGARTFLQEEIMLVTDVASQIGLALGNARLREQAERNAIASERSRVLRELHDSVSQSLFTANLIADTLPRIWEQHPQEARKGLYELRQLTRSALAEMRGLLLDLGPATLTEKPLGVLLHRLADAVSSRSGLSISEHLDDEMRLPAPVQVALYRIAEEALNNVIKHASATEISMSLICSGDTVELVVWDNGRGFDPATVAPDHLGLGIMRERAEQVGAILSITTAPDDGTRIGISWQDSGESNDA